MWRRWHYWLGSPVSWQCGTGQWMLFSSMCNSPTWNRYNPLQESVLSDRMIYYLQEIKYMNLQICMLVYKLISCKISPTVKYCYQYVRFNGNKTTFVANLNIYFTISKTIMKVTVSFIMSVCLLSVSICPVVCPHWTVKFWLKYGKNNRHFTGLPTEIFYSISLYFPWIKENFRNK